MPTTNEIELAKVETAIAVMQQEVPAVQRFVALHERLAALKREAEADSTKQNKTTSTE